MGRRDRKAEDEAETRDCWQAFRAAASPWSLPAGHAAERGPVLSTTEQRPSCEEGLRVARALPVDLSENGPLDPEWKYAALSKTVAAPLLPPGARPFRSALRYHILRCSISRVHFDVLSLIYRDLDSQGRKTRGGLYRWRQDVTDGRLQRPLWSASWPIPDQVKRDVYFSSSLRFWTELAFLLRGVPPLAWPRGRSVRGTGVQNVAGRGYHASDSTRSQSLLLPSCKTVLWLRPTAANFSETWVGT